MARPMTFQRASTVRAAALRSMALSFEGVLDRVEVRAVGRQVKERCACRLDGGTHAGALVASEVVHHHDVAWVQIRDQDLVDIILEELAVDGSSRTMGATMPLLRSPATKVVVFQWPCGTAMRRRSPRCARP